MRCTSRHINPPNRPRRDTGDGYGFMIGPEPGARLTACRIASPRLALDPLRPEDAHELAVLLDDLSLHRFTGGKPAPPNEMRARVERQVRGRSPNGKEVWLNWVVREQRTGHIVGTTQATVLVEQTALIRVLASSRRHIRVKAWRPRRLT
jgi:RimJ/RimL family protein N-acetyltransferase